MKLNNLIQINEQNEKINKIIEFITKNLSDERLEELINKEVKDTIPSDWKEQGFNSEEEFIKQYDTSETEESVANSIVMRAMRRNNINLSSSEKADVLNWFYNKFNL